MFDINYPLANTFNKQESYIHLDITPVDSQLIFFDGFYTSLNEKAPQSIEVNYKSIKNANLILYSRSNCPFSQIVLSYIYNHRITSISIKDIGENSQYRTELINIGGKPQVPCLIINGKPMYESQEIINWLKHNKDKYSVSALN